MKFVVLTLTANQFAKNYLLDLIDSDPSLDKDAFEFVQICDSWNDGDFKELKKNRTGILEAIKELNSDCVISIGSDLTKLLLGNVALSRVVAKVIPLNNEITVIPCYDPRAVTYDNKIKEQIPLVLSALKLKFIADFSIKKPTIIKLDSEERVKEAIDTLSKEEYVGFDIETAGEGKSGGLSPFNPKARILTAAFASKDYSYWLDVNYSEPLTVNTFFLALLNELKDKLVIHNRPFDVLFTKVITGVSLDKSQDSMLVHFLIDENQQLGLKPLSFKLLGWSDYADGVKSATKETKDFSKVDLESLGMYNALDAAACLHVFEIGVRKLPDLNLYRFLLKVQNMYINASIHGIPIDLEYIASYKKKILAEKEALLNEIYQYNEIEKAKQIVSALESGWLDKDLFLSTGKVKWVTKKPTTVPEVDYDIMKPRHLLALLSVLNVVPDEKTPKGMVSLAAKTLESIDHPIIQQLARVKSISTIASTFITGFLEKVKPDGKIHPNFALTRTVTGRTACSDPNVQQIPRDKEIKNFFYVPEGYKLVQFDFAQAEIRVIASFAEDENLVGAILKGTDMHKEVAAFMYQKPVEDITKEERQAAKALNFGVVYGMGGMALSKNLGITQEEADDKLARYMQQFSGVKRWIDETHAFARKNLKVVTPLGRVRHLPEIALPDRGAVSGALRQAQNAPVQATASDLTLWLLLHVFTNMDRSQAQFLASVHDSGLYAVRNEYYNEFIELLKQSINELNTRFTFLKVPMKIDISVAEADETGKVRWGKVEEVEV